MLKLDNIKKDYHVGDFTVHALRGVSLEFRKNEFVSILGPSGCGKTTMLNIIGGLDRYTSGDLIIDKRSTKDFKDKDWDAYRNHAVGFVFQNYNLISHQSVLDNVAIALTLSGIGPAERRQRAMEALTSVGIADQAHKKPNQLSGGQMQRVAIARALVNNPKIIMADEPTGALDSATSDQIMRILKDVSKDRLVIMVTHNGDLAQEYSNRIIRLKDGEIIEDTNPIKKEKVKKDDEDLIDIRKTSMSWFTALKLSFKNLLTKKTRTILTAIAGSIGIIGVALVLAISSGMNSFIMDMQRGTLASFPIEISQATWQRSGDRSGRPDHTFPTTDEINRMPISQRRAHLNDFTNQDFIELLEGDIAKLTLDGNKVIYTYETMMNFLHKGPGGNFTHLGNSTTRNTQPLDVLPDESLVNLMFSTLRTLEQVNPELKASMPEDAIPLTLQIDQNNRVSNNIITMITGKLPTDDGFGENLTFTHFLGAPFKLVNNKDIIHQDGSTLRLGWDTGNFEDAYENGRLMYIDRIIRPREDSTLMITGTGLGYPSWLPEQITNQLSKDAEYEAWVKATFGARTDTQLQIYTSNVFANSVDGMIEFITQATTSGYTTLFGSLTPEQRMAVFNRGFGIDATPNGVNIYAADFDSKEQIKTILAQWNDDMEAAEKLSAQFHFTDLAEIVTNMVTNLLDVVSIVLAAFASVSLVVSTIMIGIITYVSVVERTKEIGILRSIGARKKDIARVFNAETLIVGLTSGLIGIIVTYILSLPINLIIAHFAGVSGIAALPILVAGGLVLLSMGLTLVGGFIPSRIAARKDPVVALRTE